MPDIRTGSHYLHRKPTFNKQQPDIDIPDGDAVLGKKIFTQLCTGCHQLDINTSYGPMIRDVFGRRHGVKKFHYSVRMGGNKNSFRWSKQRLYIFLEQPDAMFPDTNMFFDGISNPYQRASLIQYLNLLRRQDTSKPFYYQ